jgi:hypothetical protein
MAVGSDYLKKIRVAIRRYTALSADLTVELTDTVEECRADLIRLGIPSAVAISETDYHVLDAVKRYARYAFEPQDSDVRAALWDEYRLKADELRRMRDYAYLTITFTVKTAGAVAIADALVTFNGQSIYTDSTGQAVFYYVYAGQNQEYSIEADGYVSQTVDLDVAASATVAVTMVAA